MDLGSILQIRRGVANLGRAQEIVGVLARHGWHDVLERVGLSQRSRFGRKPEPEAEQASAYERVRRVLEDLGPTFVKLGQVLSYRPDLVPSALADELRKLESDVPPFPGDVAVALVERELDGPLDEHFQRFERTPFAAGSMAQAHRARMRDGVEVVVKVRRPDLQETIERDLDIIGSLARLIEEQIPEARPYRPVEIVREFSKAIRSEVDFRTELRNLQRFAANLGDFEGVRSPLVFPKLSGAAVLTIEHIEGTMASSGAALRTRGVDTEALARRIIALVTSQIFEDRFFHADPHGGNLIVRDDGMLVPIDAGMAGRVDTATRDDLLELLVHFVAGDMEEAVGLIRRAGWAPDGVAAPELVAELETAGEHLGGADLAELQLGPLMAKLLEVLAAHRLRPPRVLALIGKVVATAEGVARELSPELKVASVLEPKLKEIYAARLLSPDFATRHVRAVLGDVAELVATAPRDLSELLRRTSRGELRLALKHEADREALRASGQAANRLALAACIAGGLVAGAVLLAAAPTTGVTAIVGWTFLVGAGLGGFALAYGFIRSGNL